MNASIFDNRICELGEGPLWHPMRQQLFWFDILAKRLLTVDSGTPRQWQFDEHVSAAGWIDRDRLLIASETQMFSFDIVTGEQTRIAPLEAEVSGTRSNDGRADPWGGFWIGTMGKNAEPKAGKIYRFFKGKLTELFHDLTIPNSICFSPDRNWAYFTDTAVGKIKRQALDAEGWPIGQSQDLIDLSGEDFGPDGSVVDAEGCIWNAQWGASRVARYAADGKLISTIELPARQVSCPAFGGARFDKLYATSAVQGMQDSGPHDGQTFRVQTKIRGLPEYKVKLEIR